MRAITILQLVWLNLIQNKFKTILTSIGIVVGAATIVLVFGIGLGGRMEIAEQFAQLNAGAIDVSFKYARENQSTGKGNSKSFGNAADNAEKGNTGRGMQGNGSRNSGADNTTSRMNQEQIIFTLDDLSDIEQMVGEIDGTTLSYTARGTIEGGTLTKSQTLTVAGVKEDYALLSKLQMAEGTFLNTGQDFLCEKVCVLGNKAAEEIFGSGSAVTGETIYISDRMYTVIGVLETAATVSAGISPDTSIFIPYETGIKYLTGENISPKITVLAHEVDTLESVITGIKSVLMGKYPNAEFVFEDSGSKMKAAQSSNRTLTILLSAMAMIVFLVGGIGIMNVLFVSVKERTNEIGILKAIGTSKTDILSEFLAESALISLIGGMIGILVSLGLVPILEYYQVRVEISSAACFAALGFALLTGIIFGIYPAWKAAKLEPVEALQAD